MFILKIDRRKYIKKKKNKENNSSEEDTSDEFYIKLHEKYLQPFEQRLFLMKEKQNGVKFIN